VKAVLKWQMIFNSEPQMVGGGKIIHVDEQYAQPTIWTEEDDTHGPGAVPATREVIVVGTGHEIPESHPYHLGTYLTQGGAFVWHIYGNVDREGIKPF
jgi:hypothetical protein